MKDHVTEIPSHVLDFVRQRLGCRNDIPISIRSAKSAQQRVWILTLPPMESYSTCNDDWKDAFEHGSHRLVVRLWISAKGWWNLNHLLQQDGDREDLLEKAARSEITGYRLARQALTDEASLNGVWIPRVLYFSGDNKSHGKETLGYPWAVLEYVGEHSRLYVHSVLPVASLIDQMVKTRHEFGFDEPHPRWGRLPVEECLSYAQLVLRKIVVPLHLHYQKMSEPCHFDGLLCSNGNEGARGFRYMDMVRIYRQKLSAIENNIHMASATTTSDNKLQKSFRRLSGAIDRLEMEAIANGLASCSERGCTLPCVLCHMDLQPQNLLFCQTKTLDNVDKSNSNSRITIRSVLDWEEAAYADPRFELLLLCRKVVANQTQANHLWQFYQQATQRELGPIVPWLKLETVQSLTTLLLQACAGGGRSPWESKPELWSKVEREFQRLVRMGWIFCQLAEND